MTHTWEWQTNKVVTGIASRDLWQGRWLGLLSHCVLRVIKHFEMFHDRTSNLSKHPVIGHRTFSFIWSSSAQKGCFPTLWEVPWRSETPDIHRVGVFYKYIWLLKIQCKVHTSVLGHFRIQLCPHACAMKTCWIRWKLNHEHSRVMIDTSWVIKNASWHAKMSLALHEPI